MKNLLNNLNLRNVAIGICILLIIASLAVIFMPEKEEKIGTNEVTIQKSNVKEDEEITESQARKMAVKQFKDFNEKLKENQLHVIKINREGDEYYYITSKSNNMEIRIKGGKVTRINTVPVEDLEKLDRVNWGE